MPHFPGPAYSPEHDQAGLETTYEALRRFWEGALGTLEEASEATGVPPASASALIRPKIAPRDKDGNWTGLYMRDRRRRGDPAHGLFEYKIEKIYGAGPSRRRSGHVRTR